MKTPIPTLALVLAALGAAQTTQAGMFSIQLESDGLTRDDLTCSGAGVDASMASNRMGLRIAASEKLGIDVLGGFSQMSGHGADTATDTEERKPCALYSVEAGVSWKLAEGERASLALLGRGGVTVVQTSDETSTYSNGSYQQRDIAYSLTIPSLFVGVEPSVALAPNFQLYSVMGVRYAMMPASKRAKSNPDGGEPTLVTMKDAKTAIGLSGLSLGMRYVF